MRNKLIAFGIAIAATFAIMSPAGASSTTITGSLTRNTTTFYTTGRTITVGGSGIFFRKTDGPEIDLKWYKCSDRNVSGAFVNFPNPDPTARKQLGSGFLASTVFCLAAFDYGTNATDTFTGPLDWNVFS
jgi:hypothetical protein